MGGAKIFTTGPSLKLLPRPPPPPPLRRYHLLLIKYLECVHLSLLSSRYHICCKVSKSARSDKGLRKTLDTRDAEERQRYEGNIIMKTRVSKAGEGEEVADVQDNKISKG